MLDIPHSNTGISGSSNELTIIEWMKLSIIYCIGMSFRQIKIFNPHISLYCQQISCSISINKSYLFVAIDDHQMASRGIEAQRADSITSKWLNDTKTVHVFVHAMEIP